MNNKILFLSLIFLSLLLRAAPLETCLSHTDKVEHRLDRINAVQACFDKNKKTTSVDSCFLAVETNKLNRLSEELSEQIKTTCFYDIAPFKTIKSCLQRSASFVQAGNHDEAIFECYRQFEDRLNQKECLKVSASLRYPAKKDYLAEHCLSL